ncbi:hypothetical protein M378DRAFT_154833 [Amanita muscaria Koide BX008]|uniref:Uncharacterized protein n=1 Tax=Amanita muscaria (strain Koide BX008) TaxID=946122 RepID=A0A0C2TVC9_AMAMK|nr:hypothetical protein M378DRAFT_154833 [Amanita muscaria Koide BX008]
MTRCTGTKLKLCALLLPLFWQTRTTLDHATSQMPMPPPVSHHAQSPNFLRSPLTRTRSLLSPSL